MNGTRFDDVARAAVGRRTLLAGGLAFGAGWFGLPAADAGKKPEQQRLKFNQYGCVDAGNPCRGDGGNCCSGICDGKKPKRGKRDRSRCAAHHTGGCSAARAYCDVYTPASICGSGDDTYCFSTTGNAGFCVDFPKFEAPADCHACRTDLECEALGYPAGSACILIPATTYCGAPCPTTGNRGCAAPAVG